jgi:hypothetical protein
MRLLSASDEVPSQRIQRRVTRQIGDTSCQRFTVEGDLIGASNAALATNTAAEELNRS